MSAENGGPAFPCEVSVYELGQVGHRELMPGMTLRDYFASKALLAVMDIVSKMSGVKTHEQTAEIAYSVADAMIKERNKI